MLGLILRRCCQLRLRLQEGEAKLSVRVEPSGDQSNVDRTLRQGHGCPNPQKDSAYAGTSPTRHCCNDWPAFPQSKPPDVDPFQRLFSPIFQLAQTRQCSQSLACFDAVEQDCRNSGQGRECHQQCVLTRENPYFEIQGHVNIKSTYVLSTHAGAGLHVDTVLR